MAALATRIANPLDAETDGGEPGPDPAPVPGWGDDH